MDGELKGFGRGFANRELDAGEATAGGCEQVVGLDRSCPQSDVEAAKNLWPSRQSMPGNSLAFPLSVLIVGVVTGEPGRRGS
jgi:hypothetical protein